MIVPSASRHAEPPAPDRTAAHAADAPNRVTRARWIAPLVLFAVVVGLGVLLAVWKRSALAAQAELAAQAPEPMEAVTAAVAREQEHVRATTAIGTVLALRSVTLRNELAGRVSEVALVSGAIVEEGAQLVAFDVSVEEAELRAQEAEAELAETLLRRMERARDSRGASEIDVDRARSERDVARAEVARIRAVIERKTLRAPFRARVGLADVHPGQYLDAGTELTTLQGVDAAMHVDFSVTQDVAARLAVGDPVTILGAPGSAPIEAPIVALDAQVERATRNAYVRARIEGVEHMPAPGSSVRVRVPVGEPALAVVVPVSALRKGPAGEHVFVLAPDPQGTLRAQQRTVVSGPALGDEVVIASGLAPGERVASSGSFKLLDGVRVAVAER